MAIRTPKGLTKQSRATWRHITASHILSADGLLILEAALREFDGYMSSPLGSTSRCNCYRNFLAGFRALGLSAGEQDASL